MASDWYPSFCTIKVSPLAAHIQGAINECHYIESPTYSFIHSYRMTSYIVTAQEYVLLPKRCWDFGRPNRSVKQVFGERMC